MQEGKCAYTNVLCFKKSFIVVAVSSDCGSGNRFPFMGCFFFFFSFTKELPRWLKRAVWVIQKHVQGLNNLIKKEEEAEEENVQPWVHQHVLHQNETGRNLWHLWPLEGMFLHEDSDLRSTGQLGFNGLKQVEEDRVSKTSSEPIEAEVEPLGARRPAWWYLALQFINLPLMNCVLLKKVFINQSSVRWRSAVHPGSQPSSILNSRAPDRCSALKKENKQSG